MEWRARSEYLEVLQSPECLRSVVPAVGFFIDFRLAACSSRASSVVRDRNTILADVHCIASFTGHYVGFPSKVQIRFSAP